jgi:hypothetical protein
MATTLIDNIESEKAYKKEQVLESSESEMIEDTSLKEPNIEKKFQSIPFEMTEKSYDCGEKLITTFDEDEKVQKDIFMDDESPDTTENNVAILASVGVLKAEIEQDAPFKSGRLDRNNRILELLKELTELIKEEQSDMNKILK